MHDSTPILRVESLVKIYHIAQRVIGGRTQVRALDGVDLSVFKGETLGVVGESGCGKSTLGRMIVCLDKPTSGRVVFQGKDVSKLSGETLKAYRRQVQIVFQDPASSLNPRKTVGETLVEPLVIHKESNREERKEKVYEALQAVGLPPAYTRRYPHELSGGQRQRVGIARALIMAPKLVVADEPVSSLDVSIQAQILNLLKDLRDRFHLTYLFISHDLKVVRFMSDRIAVMYAGRVMEIADRDTIYEDPRHPYTKLLIASIPSLKFSEKPPIKVEEAYVGAGVVKDGCPLIGRCPEAREVCRREKPQLREVAGGHWVACHVQ
ncbi:MAG TPA: ATP-binding cassette domain-containing protein [Syntrophales bacterium]|nr:ATP-binding cassette domain-containing protein [Syntrophales bacterium]HOL58561.1 ATP-binding cassette domain-containing protein [Syntrophales bacterium]HPO34831.1 ATP-binding cassette domain-containing protein [Syntrophales bacterium]